MGGVRKLSRAPSAAGMTTPRRQRIDGAPIPQEGPGPKTRIKGGLRPAWKDAVAKGPVPATASVKRFLKGKGTVHHVDNLKDMSAAAELRDLSAAELVAANRGRGKRRADSVDGSRGRGRSASSSNSVRPWRYFSDETRTDPLPQATGIRILRREPSVRSGRLQRAQEARARSASGYSVRAPYEYDDVSSYGGSSDGGSRRRTGRRTYQPSLSPGVELRGSIVGVEQSPARPRGRNLSCRPVDVGVFDKVDSSPRSSKYCAPSPSYRQREAERDERLYLPCNFREKGVLSSTREGSLNFYAKGSRQNPEGSLLAAWNVSDAAPERAQTTGLRKKVEGHSDVSSALWGAGARRNSASRYCAYFFPLDFVGRWIAARVCVIVFLAHQPSPPPPPPTNRYHRRKSFDAIATVGIDTRDRKRAGRGAVQDKSYAPSSIQGAPESPRTGKRMLRSPSEHSASSVIPMWG